MRRFGLSRWMPLLLPALVSLPACAAGPVSSCASVSTAQIAALLKRDPGTIRMSETTPAPGHLQCDFKSMERVVGGEDAMAGEVALDIYRFADAGHAAARLKGIGSPALEMKTASPAGTDDVVQLGEQVRTENVNREPGYAARHGEVLVIAQMSGTFMQDRPGEWPVRMQTLALESAGATVTGPLFPYACQVLPPATVQTLLTLDAATLIANPDYATSLDKCSWAASANDRRIGTAELTIQRNVSPEAIAGQQANAGSRGTLVTTNDPADRVYITPGDRGEAIAFHGTTRAHIELNDPDVHAVVSPSFGYRLQRSALLAAGATVLPSQQFGPDPAALAETAAPKAHGFLDNLSVSTVLPVILVVGVVWLVFSMIRRGLVRRDLMQHGMDGTARVVAVRDTGVTVNNSPMVHFDVVIQPPVGVAYNAQTRSLVSRLSAPASLVGQTLPVKIDRNDPQRFVFVQPL